MFQLRIWKCSESSWKFLLIKQNFLKILLCFCKISIRRFIFNKIFFLKFVKFLFSIFDINLIFFRQKYLLSELIIISRILSTILTIFYILILLWFEKFSVSTTEKNSFRIFLFFATVYSTLKQNILLYLLTQTQTAISIFSTTIFCVFTKNRSVTRNIKY